MKKYIIPISDFSRSEIVFNETHVVTICAIIGGQTYFAVFDSREINYLTPAGHCMTEIKYVGVIMEESGIKPEFELFGEE